MKHVDSAAIFGSLRFLYPSWRRVEEAVTRELRVVVSADPYVRLFGDLVVLWGAAIVVGDICDSAAQSPTSLISEICLYYDTTTTLGSYITTIAITTLVSYVRIVFYMLCAYGAKTASVNPQLDSNPADLNPDFIAGHSNASRSQKAQTGHHSSRLWSRRRSRRRRSRGPPLA
ncbi:hypothetical protein BDZ89DRAFT_1129590 [Hymenopellis radicata]|nr:hypothetical protein BDZ89DRAFT_1129590 [Hymenopellis radicata]